MSVQPEPAEAFPLQGSLLVMASSISIGVGPDGSKALIIEPLGTNVEIVVPLQPDVMNELGREMTAPSVVIPGANGVPPVI